MNDEREWIKWMVSIFIIAMTALMLIAGIMTTVRLTQGPAGPPPTCGTGGVFKVIGNADGDNNTLVVCKDGRSFWP
jgi:hypothetical protein